jgi:two-component system, LytTR family, sensor histidine kinase AlgZ
LSGAARAGIEKGWRTRERNAARIIDFGSTLRTLHRIPTVSPPRVPVDRLDPDFAPTGDAATRPPSLWPHSTRPASGESLSFAATAFDPLRQERAREQERAAMALEVCSSAVVLRVLLFLQCVLAVGVLARSQSAADWLRLQPSAAFMALVGGGLWLLAVCALRQRLALWESSNRALALMGAGAVAGAVAWAPLAWAELVAPLSPWQLAALLLAGPALAGSVLAWLDWRARLWQPSEARVRLAELQSRIRPHFLFNALNTAVALVRVAPDQAERVLEDLAELFRVALSEQGASVSLEEEIALAQRYLAIEQVRYGSRLKVHWEIDSTVGRARVPPLVLQPLVENAVRHGVEPAIDGGSIWVQASARRGQAVVLVSNTVPPEASQPGAGVALANVAERLRLLHDMAGQLEVWREGELFLARIIVPLP